MLYEKYRPKTLDDFIGQDKVKRQVQALTGRDSWDRDAIWIQGPSGTGKTTLSWIIAHQVASDLFIQELDGDIAQQHPITTSLPTFSRRRTCARGRPSLMCQRRPTRRACSGRLWITGRSPLPTSGLWVSTRARTRMATAWTAARPTRSPCLRTFPRRISGRLVPMTPKPGPSCRRTINTRLLAKGRVFQKRAFRPAR